jgi:CRP/FNR family transcriptional regulator, cyclic AMP receptor protein
VLGAASIVGPMSETIWYLKRCPLFERLSAAETQRLDSRSVARTFQRKEIIYFPTDPGRSVLVLARGRVKIKAIVADGRETIFAFIEPGGVFGELAIIDGEKRNEYAEAAEDSLVLSVPREEVLWLMERQPQVSLHITKLLGLRLRRLENRLQNVLFHSIRERIVSLLLELLETHGSLSGGRWELRIRLSHEEFAGLIGATRETVTATLGQMRRDGLIEIQRKRIVVLDRPRLLAELKDKMGMIPSKETGNG